MKLSLLFLLVRQSPFGTMNLQNGETQILLEILRNPGNCDNIEMMCKKRVKNEITKDH